MYNYLIDHAVKNVWCTPDQDNQLIFSAVKISQPYGELHRFRLMNQTIALPKTTGATLRYHIYKVGQMNPALLNLLSIKPEWITDAWISMSSAMKNQRLFVDVYDRRGISLSRRGVYYLWTDTKALVFAVPIIDKYKVDYENDQIYFRFYSNAYYESVRSNPAFTAIDVFGDTPPTTAKYLELVNQYNTSKYRPGYTYAFVNGKLVDNFTYTTGKLNDDIDFVYDRSVKKTVTFKINELQSFRSDMDDKYKYILHHQQLSTNTIDYEDDIDIYVMYRKPDGTKIGHYYNKNAVDAVRMLTHRDYGVPVEYVMTAAQLLAESLGIQFTTLNDYELFLIIREAGYVRPLVQDNNRIFELYKLDDVEIMQAMTGLHSTVPVWTASALESSGYTEVMRSTFNQINIDLVEKAYGYNAISVIMGDTPRKTEVRHGRQVVDVPYGLYENSTGYEHSGTGLLIDVQYHESGNDYECVNSGSRLVEMVSGKASPNVGTVIAKTDIVIPDNVNYRVYECKEVNGVADNNWIDITKTNRYLLDNRTIIYDVPGVTDQLLMVRHDRNHLYYEMNYNTIAGTLYFDLFEKLTTIDGDINYIMTVPMGQLDVWLNGNRLVRGLDYFIVFPRIHIVNKRHLIQPAGSSVQKIAVRFTSFCSSDMKLDPIEDYGFVDNGLLSRNNRFDIRDDKVLSITVGGKLKHRSDLLFSEDHRGVGVVVPENGLPYQIKDIVVPLKGHTQDNTYELRAKSQLIDKQVSDYLTLKLPEPDRGPLNVIPNRWPIVSPFLSHIINDIVSGQFDLNSIDKSLSDNEALAIAQPYEYLLNYDVIGGRRPIDERYVAVHAHQLSNVIPVTVNQYRFIRQLVRLYADDKVDLSHFLTVENP